jgi:hypothetical protein
MPKYETRAGQVTEADLYQKLIENLRIAQEDAAMLSHLRGLNHGVAAARGWLVISEQLKAMQRAVIAIAVGKLQ